LVSHGFHALTLIPSTLLSIYLERSSRIALQFQDHEHHPLEFLQLFQLLGTLITLFQQQLQSILGAFDY
jgi:hypothetical protein